MGISQTAYNWWDDNNTDYDDEEEGDNNYDDGNDDFETDSVIPDDCRIFFQRAAFPSSPVTCNLDNDDNEDYFDYDDLPMTEIKVWMSLRMSLRMSLSMSMRMCLGW